MSEPSSEFASLNEVGDRCSICLTEWDKGHHRLSSLRCGHVFCSSCIDKWGQQSAAPKCPLCNREFELKDVRKLLGTPLQEKLWALEGRVAQFENTIALLENTAPQRVAQSEDTIAQLENTIAQLENTIAQLDNTARQRAFPMIDQEHLTTFASMCIEAWEATRTVPIQDGPGTAVQLVVHQELMNKYELLQSKVKQVAGVVKSCIDPNYGSTALEALQELEALADRDLNAPSHGQT